MARVVDFGKLCKQGAHRWRNRHQSQRRFSGDTKGSFRADKRSQEIVPRLLRTRSTQINYPTSCEHNATAQYMIGSRAVFQAMDATGALRNISTNRTGWLARGIGNVMQIKGRSGARHLQVDDTGLHHCDTIGRVDLENLAHAREFNYHALI